MAVRDLTGLISPGMQLARQQQAVSPMQDMQQSAYAASRELEYQRAEAELQAAYADIERTSSRYNELVDAYNAAETAAEQANMDALIEERAAEFNAAVRRYNDAGNRYQTAGIISGFTVIDEFTPTREERKPTLSALPETQTTAELQNWWLTPGYKTAMQNIQKADISIDDFRQPLYPVIIAEVKDTGEKTAQLIRNADQPLLPVDEQKRLISNAQQSPQMVGTAASALNAVAVSGAQPQEKPENLRYLTEPLLPRDTQKAIITTVQEIPEKVGESLLSREPLIPRETQQKYIDNFGNLLQAGQLAMGTVFTDRILKSGETAVNTAITVSNFAQTPANATPEEQEALKMQRQEVVEGVLNTVFPLAPDNVVSDVSGNLAGKTDAELLQDQRDYMTKLGNTQIALGESLSKISPQAGQLLKGSGSEILVSRDFQTEGLISTQNGMLEINRPSVYDLAAFGGALGAAGAAVGTGAVTGVSGFGPLIARTAPLAIEGEAVATGYVTGGARAAGQALANAAASESAAKTALAGASALGISLSEVDYGIGDILDQYPRRDEDRRVINPMPGEVGIGRGVLDEYPPRDKYGSGNRYNRNNQNREQNWNRSELDYRGSVGSGHSTRLVEDSVLRTRNQEANRNRYRNEFDYLYEYATVAEVAPRVRRASASFADEDSVIAPSRKNGKGRKKHFTERLIL